MLIPETLKGKVQRLVTTAVAGTPPPREKILHVHVPLQLQTNWCWAAVAVGIAEAYGDIGWTQCGVAADTKGEECCSAGFGGSNCNRPHVITEPLDWHFDAVHFHDAVPEHRTFTFVQRSIDAGRPLVVRIDYRKGNTAGHFIVIAGYVRKTAGDALHVWDPKTGMRSEVPFSEVLDNGLEGFWESTYETKGALPVPEQK